jgi:nucleoside-diphosphate-sugar epimerase
MLKKYEFVGMLKNSHILITGANGFVGESLTKQLIKKGAKVVRLVRSKATSFDENAVEVCIDLMSRKKVKDFFLSAKPEYVIHLASSKNRDTSRKIFLNTYKEDISISINVIEACLNLPNFKRLIFLGSCDEYGTLTNPFDETQQEIPINPYGLSKLAITKYLTALHYSHQFPSIVLRPTVIYGPNQGGEMFLPSLIKSLLLKQDFPMTYGDQCRDFVYIDDVVDAIIKAIIAGKEVNGRVINIGAGFSCPIKNIASKVASLINKDALSYIKFGLVPYRHNESMDYAANIRRAVDFLGWRPSTTLEQGLETTVNYFRDLVKSEKFRSDI